MQWNECYEKIQLLSPKAAKLASRMLRKDPLVPSNWGFALDVALTARAQGAGALTPADLETIAAGQRDEGPPAASTFSEELRRLADGRISPDEIARCASERLETEGHRSPLAVAREQFIAAPAK